MKRLSTAIFGMVWLALLGTGIAFSMRYDYTPGAAGVSHVDWPAESQLQRAAGEPTLVMLVHPKCPCTEASLDELVTLLGEHPGPVKTHVVFFKPEHAGDDWMVTDTWKQASAIRGVTVSVDQSGAEARHFGGETSGDVYFYDAAGHLAFHGGITRGRGEDGDNAGFRAVSALLAGSTTASSSSPVFGCSLHDAPSPTAFRP